jgi:hypothetical protein
MSDQIFHFATLEQARNAALKWLEERSASFGPHRKIEIGRMGVLQGKEVGVSSVEDPFWRIRLDYDPQKQAHFNVEHGKGMTRRKAAFCFHGTEELIAAIAKGRGPR